MVKHNQIIEVNLQTSKSIPIPIYEKDGGEITLIDEENKEENKEEV